MSGHEHLSEDALLDVVYGIAASDVETHLRRCGDCAQRLNQWHERRLSSAAQIEIPSEFLAAQRRRIYERIELPSAKRWLWAPGFAAACALAVGVFVYHPVQQRSVAQEQHIKRTEISDAQLFGDVYSIEQSVEPEAAAPARALFEEHQ